MSVKYRKSIIKKIENKRGRPLIVYATSSRPSVHEQMDQEMIPILIHHIENIPLDFKEVDFLIMSDGGDPIVSWRVITLLRSRFEKITAMVPNSAFSAATLLVLGANDIIMHPFGNLGPLDMQFKFAPKNKDGNTIFTSYEDIKNYFEFLKDINIQDQSILAGALTELISDISPLNLGYARRGSQLGLSMTEKILLLHMQDKKKVENITKKLNTEYYHHGYPVDRKEAEEIGLIITKDIEIEQLIWKLSQDIICEFKSDQPIDQNNIIIKDLKSKNMTIDNGVVYSIEEQLIYSLVESSRLTSCKTGTLLIQYKRNDDLSFNITKTVSRSIWN